MATMATLPSMFQEKSTTLWVDLKALMRRNHHHHGQHAAHTLTQEGGPCHTGYAHLETGHEQDVHADVDRDETARK